MTFNITAKEIYEKAISCGFEDCGIIKISKLVDYKKNLEKRIENVPESEPFYKNFRGFGNIQARYSWGKSIIICTSWYGKYRYPVELQKRYAKAFFLSCDTNPNCQEYIGKKNFENWLNEKGIRYDGGDIYSPTKIFPLRPAAALAGLGIIRKNNFFYTSKGSYYNLEGYIIDKELEYTKECNVIPCSELCNCCQKSCPTGSLSAPNTMNPLKCISFINTFGNNALPQDVEAKQLKQWICGCDECQDGCPHNKRHNWAKGIDFPGLNELVGTLIPNNLIKTPIEKIISDVIPKTEKHIANEQADTLKIAALRAIQNKGNIE